MLTASAILGIVVLTALFLISERKLILQERKNNVRQVVEAAHGLLTHYHDLASKGSLTDTQVQQQAMQAIPIFRRVPRNRQARWKKQPHR
ncbi:putative methyl accepting chemotaxis protein (part 1) [Herminiimonas arsenicoxydans]|uniref:Methyl accepting chemotaxis protein (Part 1) n=1 Tax=Herminiimonas arsenicoxydans TaxID=204773 RepID=A4G5T9_HERAR|nr:putative methyl accepting chemotaxis protein (part 1) [Herminiimonas arsenicoxydans]